MDVSYRLMKADEAEAVVAFVRSVYGSSYPSDLFCDPATVRDLIERELLFSSVAVDSSGSIVGHLATLLERPGDLTGDGITGMVAPEFRGRNVVSQLGLPLYAAHHERGILGLHMYAITIHDISQRRIIGHGGAVTGLLLADWPAEISVTGFSTDGLGQRLPMLMMHFPLGPLPPRTVHLPAVYAEEVRRIHRDLALERELRVASGYAADFDVEASRVEEALKRRQGCAALRLHRIGGDWSRCVESWQLRHRDVPVHYLDVALSAPAAAAVILELRRRGWFFGGLLLERAGTDFLRLQRCDGPPEPDSVRLCEQGRRMLQFVVSDREGVRPD